MHYNIDYKDGSFLTRLQVTSPNPSCAILLPVSGRNASGGRAQFKTLVRRLGQQNLPNGAESSRKTRSEALAAHLIRNYWQQC